MGTRVDMSRIGARHREKDRKKGGKDIKDICILIQ
jgi:hypothetical protein